jgi:hypothetical protein
VLEEIITKAVCQTLSSIGVDVSDRNGLKADLVHLRRWRISVEQAERYTLRAVITVLVSGIAGALWLGIKMMIPGHS